MVGSGLILLEGYVKKLSRAEIEETCAVLDALSRISPAPKAGKGKK